MLENFWKQLSDVILSPKIDDTIIDAKLQAIKEQLPIPVFWLLGKTQAGKTSLIRALTGCETADIGNGFQPCTRTAQLYDFPNSEDCFLRFLDTRGLGEINYDPSDDLALFQEQVHLLIVVMKAMDHAQYGVMAALRAILAERPHWPVIVVQTCLHEGYPSNDTEHVEPYPYRQLPLPATVPIGLARSLLKQRGLFYGIKAQFVPVDFTHPDDGYTPVHYGLEALWDTIEHVLPLGLKALVADTHHQQFRSVYAETARWHIISYSLLAGGVEAIPVPFVSLPLVLSVQAKMFHTLASLYGQELNKQRLAEIGSVLGVGFMLRLGGRELLKFIPVYGSVVAAVYAAAVTYALGQTLCVYFSHVLEGDLPDEETFAQIYTDEFERGRRLLSDYLEAMKKR